jgi:pimeloyl-ACP methyl ester carboxylesterase
MIQQKKLLKITDPLSPTGYRNIAYTEWGFKDNKKVLFCIHGLTRNAHDFDYIARALSGEYRIICADMAGRGQSDWFADRSRYNFLTYIDDCIEVMLELQLGKVDWLGTSMGGIIGVYLAAQYPKFIKRMILNDVGYYIPKESMQRIRKYIINPPTFHSIKEVDEYLRLRLANFGIKKEEHWLYLAKTSIIPKGNGTYVLAYDPVIAEIMPEKAEDVNFLGIWQQLKCPTLVLRGGDSDLLTEDTANHMKITGPQADLITFDGVGHAPALMDYEQIEAVRKWLANE